MKRAFVLLAAVLMGAGMLFCAGCGQRGAEEAGADPQAKKFLVEGTVFLKQGEVVKAVQSFAAAIKVAPDHYQSYYMLAETFVHLKQFDQAQSVLGMAAKRFPDQPLTYYLMAVAYHDSGKLLPAIVAARKSVDLFRLRGDDQGEKRATILLGVLVQMAKQQSQDQMVENAAREAGQAPVVK